MVVTIITRIHLWVSYGYPMLCLGNLSQGPKSTLGNPPTSSSSISPSGRPSRGLP